MSGVRRVRIAGKRTGRRSARTSRSLASMLSLVIVAMLVFAASAFAVSGASINVGTPFESGPPAVAVGSTGTAYIAWANTKDLPPTTVNTVQYCVLPVGASACTYTGTLEPADQASEIDHVQVLVDGTTVVLLADVYGAAGSHSGEYTPEQEWQSTDGGATFQLVDGGLSVADGILSADTAPLSAVVVPGTNALGYGWDTAGSSPPTFDEFPLTSPPQCSTTKCPADETFASLEPDTNPDQIGNAGGQFASQLGTNSGVLGIFETDFTNGPLGCSTPDNDTPFGTAFVYGSGAQSASNSYDISPGSPDSAWKVAVTQADCNVDYPAVAGGPSGFGVVEDNETTGDTVYHAFDQANDSFDTPQVTISTTYEQQPAVSQDGSGGIYTTFLSDGEGGPISLAYSSNGGATWTGPGTLNPNTDEGADGLTSSVDSAGQGWAAWTDNGSVYAQQFVASDAIPPAVTPPPPAADTVTTVQTSGAESSASLEISAGTIGETDRATINGTNGSVAGGTVTYTLYNSPSCAASSKVFVSGAAAVTGGVAAASSPVTAALTPGVYYWQASYSGDAKNVANASTCGSEVLTVVPASKVGGSGTSNGTTVTLTITCASTPCTVTVTITISEASASAARKGKKHHKPKIVTIASGTFTIHTKGPQKLSVRLTKAGKKLLASHHGHLNSKVLVADKTAGGIEKTTRSLTIVTVKPKHKHKK
jgi:hypothetical protein